VNAPAKSSIGAGLVLLPVSLDELVDRVAERIAESLPVSASKEPLFVSCSKACERLGVSRATLFRARKEGMPAVRVGDDWRYEVAACADWFRGRSK
jgi:hypothetical protein